MYITISLYPVKSFYDEKYADVVTSFSLKALSKNDLFVNKEVSYIPNVTKYGNILQQLYWLYL